MVFPQAYTTIWTNKETKKLFKPEIKIDSENMWTRKDEVIKYT